MKTMKKVTIPSRTEEVIDKITCDLCGKEMHEPMAYDVDEVNVSHKTGSRYPEGGSGETTSVDMCGDCFDKKLVPWLISQGVKPITEDWDY